MPMYPLMNQQDYVHVQAVRKCLCIASVPGSHPAFRRYEKLDESLGLRLPMYPLMNQQDYMYRRYESAYVPLDEPARLHVQAV